MLDLNKVREFTRTITWKTGRTGNNKEIQVQDIHPQHLINAVTYIKERYGNNLDVTLKYQNNLTAREWLAVFMLELYLTTGQKDALPEDVINTLCTISQQGDKVMVATNKNSILETLKEYSKFFKNYYINGNSRYSLGNYTRSGLYTVKNRILKNDSYISALDPTQPALTSEEWLDLIDLMLICYSNVPKLRAKNLLSRIESIISKYKLNIKVPERKLEIVRIQPSKEKQPHLVKREVTPMQHNVTPISVPESGHSVFNVFKMTITSNDLVEYSYGIIGTEGITFTPDSTKASHLQREEAESIKDMLNKFNKDLSVDFGVTHIKFLVSYGDKYLTYDKDRMSIKLTDKAELATELSLQKAQKAIQGLTFLFDCKEEELNIVSTQAKVQALAAYNTKTA